MTVPVTGGSRSVDEETLHEFHLGFLGFIFTCNFIPVYFSLPVPPPLALSLMLPLPSLPPPPLPSPTPSPPPFPPVLLPCPQSRGDLGGSPGCHSCSSCFTPRTRRRCTRVSLQESCVISTRAWGVSTPLKSHSPRT